MPKPILLVEDEPQLVELAVRALAEAQLPNEVVPLSDGEQAIDYLLCRGPFVGRAQGNPAVLLLDYTLPKVSGLDVLERVRGTPKLSSIPVVMLATTRDQADIARGYRQGVNACVVKPQDPAEYVRLVRELGTFWGIFNEVPPGGGPSRRPF